MEREVDHEVAGIDIRTRERQAKKKSHVVGLKAHERRGEGGRSKGVAISAFCLVIRSTFQACSSDMSQREQYEPELQVYHLIDPDLRDVAEVKDPICSTSYTQ